VYCRQSFSGENGRLGVCKKEEEEKNGPLLLEDRFGKKAGVKVGESEDFIRGLIIPDDYARISNKKWCALL
jgi:hypothetical protein